MLLFFYQLLYILLLPLVIFYQLSRRDTRTRLAHFYGFFREEFRGSFPKKGCDWFHAVSLGETLILIKFIEIGLESGHLRGNILFTTTIENALHTFQKSFRHHPQKKQLYCAFLPLDFLPILRLFIRRIKPSRFFLSETDFWPLLFWLLRKDKIPTYAINVRVSERLCYWYDQFPSMSLPLFRGILKIFAQSATDQQRLKTFTSSNVTVLGNAKFDLLESAPLPQNKEWMQDLSKQIICFGSFHKDEFPIIYQARKALDPQRYLFLVAPRNLDDLTTLREELKRQKWGYANLSQTSSADSADREFLLLDTIGFLSRIYQTCHLAIIGGSFNSIGGHNPLEPMIYRRPVIVGPRMRNYQDLVKECLNHGILWQVSDRSALTSLLKDYDRNPKPFIEGSLKAYRFIDSNRGSLKRSWELIEQE